MPKVTYEAALESLCQTTGHTWLPEAQVTAYLKKCNAGSLSVLNPSIKEGKIRVAKLNGNTLLTCNTLYSAEIKTAENILRLANATLPRYSDRYLDQLIDAVEERRCAKLHINQREAVKKAINSSFMVLNGGPGTGKTFVLSFINEIHKILNKEIQIAYTAPTGKAARRIKESTGCNATTIHQRLEIRPDHMTPKSISPEINVLTVDEVSMLDSYVMNALMEAIPTGTKVILVGDTDQLPSVGPGAVLRDLIKSKIITVAQLTATFRQAGDSILFDNIQRIKHGDSHLVAGDDFKIAVPKNGLSPKEIFLWMIKQEMKEFGTENVLCLTPFRQKGDTCANVMNREIQKMINPVGNGFSKADGTVFRKGDVVMQLENKLLCANGDVGKVTHVYQNGTGIRVQYIDSEVDYSSSNISDLSLAYAMSIHKSQGSEAPSVITCLLPEHQNTANRNILYTAVTRAKTKCSLLCEPAVVNEAIKIEASEGRITLLSELLQYGNQLIKK